MKKETIISIITIMGFSIFLIIVLYPRNLIAIIGKEPEIGSKVHLTVIHRNSILEAGNAVESFNQEKTEKILGFLKKYKYSRSNTPYSKLDNMESYVIKIKNNEDEVFKAAVRGDRYFSVKDKNGNWSLYKVSGNQFDVVFLRDFYESLKSETYK